TVGGSGATSVDSVTVNSVETMNDATIADSDRTIVAAQIADQINAMQVTDFGASASGAVVTITGPASALGRTPVITSSGGMSLTPSIFTASTPTAQLHGITPADPVQYSCQQNFTLLSTDGYWNGATTYDLDGNPVGNVDGNAARPFNDGGTPSDKNRVI